MESIKQNLDVIRPLECIDYVTIPQCALAQIGYSARWATYENMWQHAEILDGNGHVIDTAEAEDVTEARDWVNDRTPQILLDILA